MTQPTTASLKLLLAVLSLSTLVMLLPTPAESAHQGFTSMVQMPHVTGYDFNANGVPDWCNTRIVLGEGNYGYHDWDSAVDQQERTSQTGCSSGVGAWVDMHVAIYSDTSPYYPSAAFSYAGTSYAGPGCDYILITYARLADSKQWGTVRLFHTRADQAPFSGYVYANKDSFFTNRWKVGTMSDDHSSGSGCASTGTHVHQGHVPNAGVCSKLNNTPTASSIANMAGYNENRAVWIHEWWRWHGHTSCPP